MGESTVRSPWSSERGLDPRPCEAESAGSRSSPSSPRNPRYADNVTPVVGGGAAELERAMDRGMRNDSRR